MIIMKFGGASLASPASIEQVVTLVRSQQDRHPVVIVSALGESTDTLVQILNYAARAECYCAWKAQEQLKDYYFGVVEQMLEGALLEETLEYLGSAFRDLHVRLLELSEGERALTPELRDWVLSLGEQLSSRLMTAVLCQRGVAAVHKDARRLILTDEQFTNAQPRLWETYARLRWSLPVVRRDRVVVMGGFMGATEDGRTTTLGRGGSDLTASLVGAALNAEEIQVWKDVDGLLTWDPRLKAGAYRVKQLSYREAAELAWAGATILHPEATAPAQRLRIPITIRNTFRPEGEGTRIDAGQSEARGTVKSITCQRDVTVLELRAMNGDVNWAELCERVGKLCQRPTTTTLLGMNDRTMYLALKDVPYAVESEFRLEGCVEVHIRSHQSVITLVGEEICQNGLAGRLRAQLDSRDVLLVPGGSCNMKVVAPQAGLDRYFGILQRALFSELDARCFDISAPAELQQEDTPNAESGVGSIPLSYLPLRERDLLGVSGVLSC